MGKNNNPINIYWAIPSDEGDWQDWSFLYPKPKTLFSELVQSRSKVNPGFFSCPAVSEKMKKILVFRSPMYSSYSYTEESVTPNADGFINIEMARKPSITNGPTLSLSLYYFMFSEDPLDMYATPPFFHEPKYTKFGSVVPGEFDIGRWFRPFTFEVQTWNKEGQFELEENEPMFYMEFKTDRPIILNRFILTKKLKQYEQATINSRHIFKDFLPLSKRYERFKNVGLREKILTEIKKNLIDEEPYKF
jgi:hypothetical protein